MEKSKKFAQIKYNPTLISIFSSDSQTSSIYK